MLRSSEMRINFVYAMIMAAFFAAIVIDVLINTWDDTRFFFGALASSAMLIGIAVNIVFRKKNYPWIKYVNNLVMIFAFLVLCEISELVAMMFMLIPFINSFYYRPRFSVLTGVICIFMLYIGVMNVGATMEANGKYFLILFRNIVAAFDYTDELNVFLIGERGFIFIAGTAMAIASVYLSYKGRKDTVRQGELIEKNLATETELNVARNIQEGILSTDFPDNGSYAVYAEMSAATQVGGDFYDYFLIDETHLAIVMGDVSGHGMAAAMFMTLAKTLIKVYALAGNSTDKVLINTNRYLAQSNPAKFFVTCWMGILDLSSGMLSYVNAGHNFPVIIRAGKGPEFLKGKPNFVLGRRRLIRYEEKHLRLSPGDKLLLYTDGVTEAQAADETFFGDERLMKVMEETKDKTPKEIVDALSGAVNEFENSGSQYDDETVLALHFKDHLQPEPPESKTFFLTKQTFDSVTDYIAERCTSYGCGEETVSKIVLATSEILANIDSYAYENGGEVEIQTKCRDRRMTVVFIDSGRQFDPLQVAQPDVTQPLSKRKPGGLGVFIVKKLTSATEYAYKNGKNILTIHIDY